jgi:membrane protein DedA with SNARE-associated domain
MDLIALAGLALVLLVKEAGVPIPVPGDLLVLGAGAALAGDLPLAAAGLALILLVGYVGGSIQYLLVRGALRRLLMATLARVGIGPERVEAIAERLRRTGVRGVAVARMTPGVRVGTIAACGVAAIPPGTFLRGLAVGNGVFVTAHFALGFVLGASAAQILGAVSGIGLIVIAVAVLAVIGAAGWALLRTARGRTAGAPLELAAWADAACPACLAVAAAELAQPSTRG